MNQTSGNEHLSPTDLVTKTRGHLLVIAPEISAVTRIAYAIPFRILFRLGFSWRIIPEYYAKPQDLTGVNLLILYRCTRGSTLSLVRLAHLKKIKVLYEIDDDLLDPPMEESWGKIYRNGHLAKIIKIFLVEADLVKAGSLELARRLTENGYPAFYQPYAAKISAPAVKTDNHPYRVGYFGTPHHRKDIEMIFPVLLALKESLKEKIELEFIGCYPGDWRRLQARVFNIERNYETFIDLLKLRNWCLGLAPLCKTKFNEAKSNSKFRDYTSAGILGVYSDLAPYHDTVISGENGWLVKESLEDWFQTIKKALLSAGRYDMLQQAQNLIQTEYSPEAVAQNWCMLLKELNVDYLKG